MDERGQRLTRGEVNEKAKVLNFYNQVHGPDYDMNSIGVRTITSSHSNRQELDNRYFAYYYRTGKPFNHMTCKGGAI